MTDQKYSQLRIKIAFGEATDQEFVAVMMHEGMNKNEAIELIRGYHRNIGEMSKARKGLL